MEFPAFPIEGTESLYPGLTKRELFAAMTMQGIIPVALSAGYGSEKIVESAIEYADLLLERLEQKEVVQTRFSQDSLVESLDISLRTFQRWRAALGIKVKRYYSDFEKGIFFNLKNRLEDKESFDDAVSTILEEIKRDI